MQIQQGEAVPVTHGTTPLQADGTLLGRRLAALIALRDHARRVLHSQNEGWPEAQRQEARQALNRVYDRFVAAYGPINKTTLVDHHGRHHDPAHAEPRDVPRRSGRHAGHGPGAL